MSEREPVANRGKSRPVYMTITIVFVPHKKNPLPLSRFFSRRRYGPRLRPFARFNL
jgi:hypothetical protein